MRRTGILTVVICGLLAAHAAAQLPPIPTVIPPVPTVPQLGAFLATGATQPHCCDQLGMYGDLVYATPGLQAVTEVQGPAPR